MRTRTLAALVATLLLASFALATWGALEWSGVAVIETRAPDGSLRATRVWYAEPEGELWLEAGTPENAWFLDVQRDPALAFTAERRSGRYIAEPILDPSGHARIRASLRRKYGLRDRWVGLLVDTGSSVAVRLLAAEDAQRRDRGAMAALQAGPGPTDRGCARSERRISMANPTCRILWLALVASLLIHLAVAFLVDLPGSPVAPLGILAPVFAMTALGTGVGSLLYRRHALSTPIQSGRLDPSTPEGLRKALAPFIVNLALSESVGLYGFVLTLLSGERLYAVGFVAAALLLMFVHRPTAADLAPPSSRSRGRDPTPLV